MASTRTQVYFTSAQRKRLDDRARRDRTTLAQVVRDAVDSYLTDEPLRSRDEVLMATYGALPGLEVPARSEWDRGYG
ncbi:MAG: hypothetical protein DLM64_05765 [Solirubrobacterales bacterium]|nr:MAG: hypothetical protein DLM64_05765 [Solirubrobacterales bacterium]